MYVELLVLEDLFLNFFCLLCVGIILNRFTKFYKLFLASSIGCTNLIFIYVFDSKIVLFVITILFALVMSLIAYSYKDILYCLKNVIYMYLSSIFIAGFIYLINVNFFPKVSNVILSLIIYLIFIPIISFVYIWSIRQFKFNYSNYYFIDIYFSCNEKISLVGFLDTGNKLVDPYFHRPIILLDSKYYDSDKANILVPYDTVSGVGLLRCFVPNKIYIKGIGYKKNLLVGLVDNFKVEGASVILNCKLMERK